MADLINLTDLNGVTEQRRRVDHGDIVIVGNGIAGLTAAVEARKLAPDKCVVIITEQSHPTVNTPALKQYAIGKLTREQLLAYPAGTERAQLIHVINARVEEVHAQEKYVTLRGGRGFSYDSLLIAAGSTPTGLPASLPGRDFDGVQTLHRLPDYLDLRRRLSEVNEAVVIGGGAHAIETVQSLLYWGIRVHWLIRGERFMSKVLDQPASNMVLESIQRAGAMVYTGTEALGIVGRVGAVAGVVTNHQQLLPCQLVLVCTGTSPNTLLARQCDLPIQHRQGIIVDDHLRTSARDIYAAGDVAAIQDPQTSQYATRAQWYAAVLQGKIAAAAMTGAPVNDGFGVPWHATRLGELSMLAVGNVLQSDEAITAQTDNSRGGYRRLGVIDDRLVGYLSLGPVQPDSLAIKRIIDEGLSIRNIKKELLRGTFDARKYFSRQRSYAVERMMTTGRIPYELEPRPLTTRKLEMVPPMQARPTTGPLATPSAAASQEARGMYGPYYSPRDTDPDVQLFAVPFVPGTVNPGLPGRTTTPTGYVGHADLTRQAISRETTIIDSTLIVPPVTPAELPSIGPLPPPGQRTPKRQFKAPPEAKPKKRQGGQFKLFGKPIERENGKESETPRQYPSSSLWSYSDKVPVVKKGR